MSSYYLEKGFATEQLTLRNVEFDLEGRSAKALINIEADFEDLYGNESKTPFHLSTLTAYRAIGQLAIGYFHTEADRLKSQVEDFILAESTLSPKNLIREPTNIPLEINFSRYIARPNRVAGKLEFDIGEGSFLGDIRFLVKLSPIAS